MIIPTYSRAQSPLNNDHLLAVNSTCGGTLTGASGEISSPNFPGPYDNQLDCQWLIVVDPALAVHLELFSFDLEDICAHDSLQVGQRLAHGCCMIITVVCNSGTSANAIIFMSPSSSS